MGDPPISSRTLRARSVLDVDWVLVVLELALKERSILVATLTSLLAWYLFSCCVLFTVFYMLFAETGSVFLTLCAVVVTGGGMGFCLWQLKERCAHELKDVSPALLPQYTDRAERPLPPVAELQLGEIAGEGPTVMESSAVPSVAATSAPAAVTVAVVKERSYQLDYMKLVVNMMVVLHHVFNVANCSDRKAVDQFPPNQWYSSFIDPFMMQSMAFASGLVYMPEVNDRKSSALLSLAAGCLVVQMFYMVVFKWSIVEEHDLADDLQCFYGLKYLQPPCPMPPCFDEDGTPLRPTMPFWKMLQSLVTPFFHLWYVVSLVVWRVVAPSWMRLRYPLLTAMFLGAATKFTMMRIGNGDTIWPHITGFFPFFVAGLVCRPHRALILRVARLTEARAAAMALTALHVGFAAWSMHADLCNSFFQHITAYRMDGCLDGTGDPSNPMPNLGTASLGHYWISAIGVLAAYGLAMPLIFTFISLMPNIDVPLLRAAGQRTLVPYVFHVALLMLLRSKFKWLTETHAPERLVPFTAIALVGTAVLYHPAVDAVLRPLVLVPLDRLGALVKVD